MGEREQEKGMKSGEKRRGNGSHQQTRYFRKLLNSQNF